VNEVDIACSMSRKCGLVKREVNICVWVRSVYVNNYNQQLYLMLKKTLQKVSILDFMFLQRWL
jgi:hypothetical protein